MRRINREEGRIFGGRGGERFAENWRVERDEKGSLSD